MGCIFEIMKIKPVSLKGIITTVAMICCLQVSAQKVDLITIDQLNARVAQGHDTTYLINFWATWCVPCVQELPNFEKLSREHENEKLKVLLINVDFKSKINSSVIPFLKKNKIQNEVFFLNEPDPQAYINRIDSSWSGAIPATVIVKENRHSFFEKDFTYAELLNEYKKFN